MVSSQVSGDAHPGNEPLSANYVSPCWSSIDNYMEPIHAHATPLIHCPKINHEINKNTLHYHFRSYQSSWTKMHQNELHDPPSLTHDWPLWRTGFNHRIDRLSLPVTLIHGTLHQHFAGYELAVRICSCFADSPRRLLKSVLGQYSQWQFLLIRSKRTPYRAEMVHSLKLVDRYHGF